MLKHAKLNAVYSALDTHNYRLALKLSSTALTRQPDNNVLKALKAVALIKLDQAEEALRLCDEVKQDVPIDTNIVDPLLVVYNACGKFTDATSVVEAGWGKCPESDYLATQYFFCLARERDFGKMQQVGMKLAKVFSGDKRYLQWVVLSILLQQQGEQAGTSSRALDLASMMLMKAPITLGEAGFLREDMATVSNARDSFRKANYNLVLHLSVLRRQGKFDAALDLLKKHQDVLICPSDYNAMRVKLLFDAGRLPEALALAEDEWLADLDDFGLAKNFIELVHAVALENGGAAAATDFRSATSGAEQVSITASSVEEVKKSYDSNSYKNAHALIAYLKRTATHSRVPLIADLELRARFFTLGDQGENISAQDMGGFMDAIEHYFSLYGGLNSCAQELKSFVCLLDPARGVKMADRLKQVVEGGASGTRPKSSDGATLERRANRMHVGLCKLQRMLRVVEEKTLDEQRDHVRAMLEKAAQLKDEGMAVDLHCLAAATLLDVDRLAASAAQLEAEAAGEKGTRLRPDYLDAIAVLEQVLTRFPDAHNPRLMLVILYARVGAVDSAVRISQSLQVKNVQFESLSHVLNPRGLADFAFYAEAADLGKRVQRCQNDAAREFGEVIQSAFLNCVLQRVPELLESQDRAAASAASARIVLDQLLGDLAKTATNPADLQEHLSQRIGDARRCCATQLQTRTQDRCVLQAFHPLPKRTSPSERLAHTGSFGPSKAPATVSLRAPELEILFGCSAGWGAEFQNASANDTDQPNPRSHPQHASALEALLLPAAGDTVSAARLRALSVEMLHALTSRDEDAFSAAMGELQQTLSATGIVFDAPEVLRAKGAGANGHGQPAAGLLVLPWAREPDAWRRLCWQVVVIALDSACRWVLFYLFQFCVRHWAILQPIKISISRAPPFINFCSPIPPGSCPPPTATLPPGKRRAAASKCWRSSCRRLRASLQALQAPAVLSGRRCSQPAPPDCL